MSTNGYAQSLIDIDDKMLALGRPLPPVTTWLSSGLKGDIRARHAVWLQQIDAWEQANPDAAVNWYELREAYKAEEEAIEKHKWGEDDWGYELLRRTGCPEGFAVTIRGKMDDRAALKRAREWMLDGTLWSLMLSGGTGCGKTTAAAWAAHQLLMRGFRPKWVRCAALVNAPMFGGEAELLKHRCRKAGVLILDDIGAGAREKDSKAWLGWLDDILDARWADKRKTIITTNIPVSVGSDKPSPLAQWLGPRLCDRLNEGAIHEIAEPSMRRKA
jgi:DNA replication protein DnaC